MQQEEIDQIVEAVVSRLMPILEEIRNNSGGFIRDVAPIVAAEQKMQYHDSARQRPAFDPSLYD